MGDCVEVKHKICLPCFPVGVDLNFITTRGSSWVAPGLKTDFFDTWSFSGHVDAIFGLLQMETLKFILSKGDFWLLLGESSGDITGVALQFCFFLNILLVLFSFPVLLLQDEASGDRYR